ncbi:hypothetical protein PTMSG1_07918 [Pyrenophora teres f. maculata]|nr:hypothetical protein PTMSG1_07918 [Pyrenophora teres f. maculata]
MLSLYPSFLLALAVTVTAYGCSNPVVISVACKKPENSARLLDLIQIGTLVSDITQYTYEVTKSYQDMVAASIIRCREVYGTQARYRAGTGSFWGCNQLTRYNIDSQSIWQGMCCK